MYVVGVGVGGSFTVTVVDGIGHCCSLESVSCESLMLMNTFMPLAAHS